MRFIVIVIITALTGVAVTIIMAMVCKSWLLTKIVQALFLMLRILSVNWNKVQKVGPLKLNIESNKRAFVIVINWQLDLKMGEILYAHIMAGTVEGKHLGPCFPFTGSQNHSRVQTIIIYSLNGIQNNSFTFVIVLNHKASILW